MGRLLRATDASANDAVMDIAVHVLDEAFRQLGEVVIKESELG